MLPASVGTISLPNARAWLSVLYAVCLYAAKHGHPPLQDMRLPLVDCPCPGAAEARTLGLAAGGSSVTISERINAASAAVPYCARVPASDQDTRIGGRWLRNQRTASAAKIAVMGAILPGTDWRASPRTVHNERTWYERLYSAVAFVQQCGRLPTTQETTLDSDGKVVQVGKWLSEQRVVHRRARMDVARKHELDRQLPGWQNQCV